MDHLDNVLLDWQKKIIVCLDAAAMHGSAGYNLMSHWKECLLGNRILRHSWTCLTVCLFFLHRVKLKEGVTFLGARPSNPTQWIVSQDVRSEGHRVVTLHCRRKESSYDQQRSADNLLHFEGKQFLDDWRCICCGKKQTHLQYMTFPPFHSANKLICIKVEPAWIDFRSLEGNKL